MPSFRIQGGRPLGGHLTPAGNKNAALPMLAACLLTDETVTLHNVPDIEDVRVMLDILTDLGVDVTFTDHTATLCAATVGKTRLDENLCRRVRSSILCAGPLAARHGSAEFVPPGGDVIGHRRLDTHFAGLTQLGFEVNTDGLFRVLRTPASAGCRMILDEASVTATENLLMAASLLPGDTEIYHAACEPHVAELGELLRAMGANIEGLGTNRIRIRGTESLHGAEHTVSPDLIEVGSFLCAAAATQGALTISPLPDPLSMEVIRRPFRRMNVEWEEDEGTLSYRGGDPLVIRSDLHQAVPKIEDGIWPAFPSDLMSVAIVLATQAKGTVLFFEKLFESRMYFVDQLIGMGASLVQCDPHRVLVSGPSVLRPGMISSPDIRAGMALIIAGLCADGETRIENIQMIDRGYEALEKKLQALGADIKRA